MNKQHLHQFGKFCTLKIGVNGPDVHQKAAGVGTEDVPHYERPWRLAVYNNFCACPPAAVIWSRWPKTTVIMDGYPGGALEKFIGENWAGIPVRQNRRPARSVKKLTASFYSLAKWMDREFKSLPSLSYEEAWSSLDAVYTWGRYVKIKYLETCRRYLGPEYEHLVAPNIRASGGWSPRKALSLIYPEYANVLANRKRNDRQTISFVHDTASELRDVVSELYIPVSFYELEALLCNYRQTLSTRKAFYVGRTIDSELEYHAKVKSHFDNPYLGTFDFFGTRKRAFPEKTLGEIHGWDGVRKDLSPLLLEYGIIWSDVIFDYNSSKDNLANPVRWTGET